MDFNQFSEKLHLQNKIFAIRRVNNAPSDKLSGCTLKCFADVAQGQKVVISADNAGCRGAAQGFGFKDGIPNTPGGFGLFLSCGAGEGFPPGEHVKCNPELAESMILGLPQKVMEGFSAVEISLYQEGCSPDLVSCLVNPDQLATLVHIFNFRQTDYDNVIMPMASGCSSLFRIPFGEMLSKRQRAVIGIVDVFARPHFAKDQFFFTVDGETFVRMLADSGDSVISAPIWHGVEKRL